MELGSQRYLLLNFLTSVSAFPRLPGQPQTKWPGGCRDLALTLVPSLNAEGR